MTKQRLGRAGLKIKTKKPSEYCSLRTRYGDRDGNLSPPRDSPTMANARPLLETPMTIARFLTALLAMTLATAARADVVINEIMYTRRTISTICVCGIAQHGKRSGRTRRVDARAGISAAKSRPASRSKPAGTSWSAKTPRSSRNTTASTPTARSPVRSATAATASTCSMLAARSGQREIQNALAMARGGRRPIRVARAQVRPTAPSDEPANWRRRRSRKARRGRAARRASGTPTSPSTTPDRQCRPIHSGFRGAKPRHSSASRKRRSAKSVELLWRTVGTNHQSKESAVSMSQSDGKFTATIPGQKSGRVIRFRIHAVDDRETERFSPSENELAAGLFGFRPWNHSSRTGFRKGMSSTSAAFRSPRAGIDSVHRRPEPPPRGNQAYVHVDAATGKPELFDFVNITPRGGGRKVRFTKITNSATSARST